MTQQPQDLWQGGPWEQPSPHYPTPPAVVIPPRAPDILRPKRRRPKRALLIFLLVFVLLLGLAVGMLVVRYLLPQTGGGNDPQISQTSQSEDPFGKLERAQTGTGVTVPISQASGPALTATEIYEKNVNSIVSIEGEGEESYGSGTGVVMTQDGYIITNAHVVADMRRVRVIFSDDSILPARLVGADAEEDIAVLKVEAEVLIPAEFGDSDQLRCGDMVVAIGDPLGYRTSITQGIVSALNRTVEVDGILMDLIQTSAPINFGNSGGALINDHGQVVGITTIKIVSDDGTVEGLGFAIPMARVKLVADRLIAGRPAAMLGITVLTQPEESGGLRVYEVVQDSNAWQAGVREDDILLSVNGVSVDSLDRLKQIVASLVVGNEATVRILRDGQELEFSFVIQSREALG